MANYYSEDIMNLVDKFIKMCDEYEDKSSKITYMESLLDKYQSILIKPKITNRCTIISLSRQPESSSVDSTDVDLAEVIEEETEDIDIEEYIIIHKDRNREEDDNLVFKDNNYSLKEIKEKDNKIEQIHYKNRLSYILDFLSLVHNVKKKYLLNNLTYITNDNTNKRVYFFINEIPHNFFVKYCNDFFSCNKNSCSFIHSTDIELLNKYI